MKVIVAGSRFITDYDAVVKVILDSSFEITELVSGRCDGVDLLGERWAEEHKIPVKPFPADWKKYGDPAGPIRNQQMVDYADALIAIRQEGFESKGTKDILTKAFKKDMTLYSIILPK